MVTASPESALIPVGNARIVECSLYRVRPHCSWTLKFRITTHLCAFNQVEKKNEGLCQALLQHGHRGVPSLWQKWLLRSLWQSSTLAPREQSRQHRTQRSLLSRKSCLLCVLLAVLPRRNPGLTSRQSQSGPVCGVEDASSVTANNVC